MKIFKHLEEKKLDYNSHFIVAMNIGFRMISGGCCALIHAFFPCFFITTASTVVKNLYTELSKKDNISN